MMYFNNFILLAGLFSLASATTTYDDGMYHPATSTVTYASVASTTSATYAPVVYTTPATTVYSTVSQSSYMGYWSSNNTVVQSSKFSISMVSTGVSSNMSMTMAPGNISMTMTVTGQVYTTTVCDFQSSCYTVVATATSGQGQMGTGMDMPTMTPFSSSERLLASGWAALALCGIALLL